MDCVESIKQRRSCRNYLEKPLEFDKLTLILEAGCHAPCAGNLQDWRFIVITKKPLIKQIAEQCGGQPWIATAPTIVVVTSVTERQAKFYGLRGERLYTVQNCSAAIENMLIAATSIGVGSCWIGAFDEIRMQDLLGMPEHVRPQAVLTFGYAAEKPQPRKMEPLETCIYFNRYGMKIDKVHRVLKDYSQEWQDKIEEAEPLLNKAEEKWHKFRKKILKRK